MLRRKSNSPNNMTCALTPSSTSNSSLPRSRKGYVRAKCHRILVTVQCPEGHFVPLLPRIPFAGRKKTGRPGTPRDDLLTSEKEENPPPFLCALCVKSC